MLSSAIATVPRAHFSACRPTRGSACPLLEAFRLGVPVVARPAGAVAELADGAGLVVADRDPAVIAELLALVLADGELRDELVAGGHVRAEAFTPERVEEQLRVAVEAAAHTA